MTRLASAAPVAVVGALFAALTTAGCAAKPSATSRCQRDDQCGDGNACSGGTCLPRAAPPAVWAIELAPGSASDAAFTELQQASAPAAAFDLTAGAKVTLTATIVGDTTTVPFTVAHLVLTVPSTIPGRPDLQFETDLPPRKSGPPVFTLQLPKAIFGRAGTFQVLPLSPTDAAHEPVRLSLPIAEQVELPLPTARLTVHGRLVSALGDPRGGFTARAYLGTKLVSNVDVTTTAGVFTLFVPASDEVAALTPGLTVELEPIAGAADPRFASRAMPVSANTDLGDLVLPPFGQPNVFHFAVHGDADNGMPVAGAVVRAWTLLANGDAGKTDFVRAAPTDDAGGANLGLLPGTTNALRVYDVAVVPPPESPYGIKCIPEFPLASGGTSDQPANLPPVVLGRRTVVSGAVRGQDGTPASGVMVLATRVSADGTTPCTPNVGAAPTAATTDDAGVFSLRLDAGTYRIEYDPPSGAPFPRLTERGVVVRSSTGATIDHPVSLPSGAVVEGTARGPDGAALPLAAVRFFELAPPAEPVLRAQARTDAQGHYRAVIPVSP
jgi:hypothetical protein